MFKFIRLYFILFCLDCHLVQCFLDPFVSSPPVFKSPLSVCHVESACFTYACPMLSSSCHVCVPLYFPFNFEEVWCHMFTVFTFTNPVVSLCSF